jgi:hypothetical protein
MTHGLRSGTLRRTLMVILGALAAVALMAATASADSPHFKHGGTPTCTFSGTTSISVSCTGTLAGLGNDDLLLRLSASGFAVYQCQNQGGNVAPGQNKVLVGPATSNTSIPADAIKNGNLTFTTNPAVLTAATTVSGAVAGCPNTNWTGVNPVLTLTDIRLLIEQPPGTVIFTCTASNSSGLKSPVTLSCV